MRGEFRYVKPLKRTYGPTLLVIAIPELDRDLDCVTEGECYYAARSVWSMTHRRYGTRWVGPEHPTRYYPDDWWEYIHGLATHSRRVYVVCPNAVDFATITGFWVHVDRKRWHFGGNSSTDLAGIGGNNKSQSGWAGRLVMGGPPDIIHASNSKGTVCLVSTRNYSEASWEQLARYTGYGNDTPGNLYAAHCDTAYDIWDQCVITSRFIRSLISGWIERDCGPWRDTAAQLSVSLWRRKFYTQKVCRHDNAQAVELERQAAWGGRNEVWYYGEAGSRDSIPDGCEPCPAPSRYPAIPGTISRLDVSSQYPAILASESFPVRLKGTVDAPTVADLKALLKYWEVIARVTINTRDAEYPSRRHGSVLYQTGRVTTTLAGPELRVAIDSGEVVSVQSAAYYERGAPLREYAAYLLRERDRCREAGDYIGECFAKNLANSIGGKFSQRRTRREMCREVVNPFGGWGPFTRTGSDGNPEQYVSIAGVSFREVELPVASKLLSALYCYLTAYGRVQMRQIRESLYPDRPFAQCTDGIWVQDTALGRLAPLMSSERRIPGKLRLQSRHTYARWITPSHYYIDGRWTLSGYRHGCVIGSDLVVTEFRDKNPVRTVPWKAPRAIKRECIKRDLAKSRSVATIGEDGWMVPGDSR